MEMGRMTYPGRLGLQQRVLPDYRAPFFDLLARACEGGLSVFAGAPRPAEEIVTGELRAARFQAARNLHLFGGPFYACYQGGLLEWLRDWDPGALIAEANPRYPATPSAVRWMHARGRPVIGWGLGSPPASGPFRLRSGQALAGFRQTRRLAFLRRFDALITYSQRGADGYAALGFPAEKIFVAHNSVSPQPAWPLPARPAAFHGRPVLLFVGRLQARKRLDLLLRACAQLEPAPRLVIVGDGPERAPLQKLAAEILPSAEFPGARRGDELQPFFAEADLFVLPGTGGLAVQQAMSYGLPVVVAQGDGTQDDLVRAGNGWQIAPDDFAALLAALRDALSDAPRLRRMGAESYRIAAEEVHIGKMVEVFVRALNSVS
jgi:glycosyltransferase involved in cell wall biosynthesis